MWNNNTTSYIGEHNTDLTQTILGVQLSIFTFVFVLGIWGNFMVIVTIFTQNRLRTSSHYFVANLAVSDLGGLCLSMPMVGLAHVVDWPFGGISCRFINPLKDLFSHVSMITLTAIAMDRYLNIAHPFRAPLTIYETKLIIALIWLADYLLVPLPMALAMTVHTLPNGIRYCAPSWSAHHRRITRVCLSILIFISMCITAIAYLRVAVAMKRQRQRIVERAQTSGMQEKLFRKQLEKNIRIVKAMVVIVLVFWLTTLPLTFIGLLFEFEVISMTSQQSYVTVSVVITLLFLQNCVNPIILYAMSKEMRVGFAACTRCRRSTKRSFSGSQLRGAPFSWSSNDGKNGASIAFGNGTYGASGVCGDAGYDVSRIDKHTSVTAVVNDDTGMSGGSQTGNCRTSIAGEDGADAYSGSQAYDDGAPYGDIESINNHPNTSSGGGSPASHQHRSHGGSNASSNGSRCSLNDDGGSNDSNTSHDGRCVASTQC